MDKENSHKKRLIIFDWDGTILDSSQSIVHFVQKAAEQCDLPIPKAMAIKQGIGSSFDEQFFRLFSITDKAIRDLFKEAFYRLVYTHVPDVDHLFLGAVELLDSLSENNYLLAIATSASRTVLNKQLKNTGISSYFNITVCASESSIKPNSLMLEMILEKLSISVNQALMVGDTHFDIEMAKKIGMSVVAINSGTQPRKTLEDANPDMIINSISDLSKYLNL
jgi:phosphoglycolate phosphatase